MTKIPQLSIFFPAFNEEANIKKTVLDVIKILKKICQKWEVIVVNDGSSDRTVEIIEGLQKNNKNIKLINHQINRGYGASIKTGFKNCRYSLIVQMDSDGQFDFKEINLFLNKIDQADLVIGFRKKRTDSMYRRILQKILWLADWVLFGLNVKDVDCGFKLIKRQVIEEIGKLQTESAITMTEFIVRTKRAGFKIAEVGVNHHPRLDGEQTGGKLKIITKAAFEGIKLWWFLLKE